MSRALCWVLLKYSVFLSLPALILITAVVEAAREGVGSGTLYP